MTKRDLYSGVQGQFNMQKLIKAIHNTNKIKHKTYDISIDAEKAPVKIKHCFMSKNTQ